MTFDYDERALLVAVLVVPWMQFTFIRKGLKKDNKGNYYYHFYLTDHLTSIIKNGSDNVKIGLAVSTHLAQDTKTTLSAMRSISYKNSANEVKKTVLANAENTLYTVVYGNSSQVPEGKKLKLMVYYTLTE